MLGASTEGATQTLSAYCLGMRLSVTGDFTQQMTVRRCLRAICFSSSCCPDFVAQVHTFGEQDSRALHSGLHQRRAV